MGRMCASCSFLQGGYKDARVTIRSSEKQKECHDLICVAGSHLGPVLVGTVAAGSLPAIRFCDLQPARFSTCISIYCSPGLSCAFSELQIVGKALMLPEGGDFDGAL